MMEKNKVKLQRKSADEIIDDLVFRVAALEIRVSKLEKVSDLRYYPHIHLNCRCVLTFEEEQE
jgi:hypothetical protein